ncbi:MAG: hypothetical protein IIA73_05800, partial [Proteobacteria bacterium]|nr:hypothetical protein [Pseudomonadota bacterium]
MGRFDYEESSAREHDPTFSEETPFHPWRRRSIDGRRRRLSASRPGRDQIAGFAVSNGWAGLIVNDGVTDRLALGERPIGIEALGTTHAISKTGSGGRDVPVEFGGLTSSAGDIVFCDEDGILATAGVSPIKIFKGEVGSENCLLTRITDVA